MDTCSKWWISHKYPLVSVKGRTVSGFLEVSTGSQMVQLPCSSTLAGSPSSLVTGWMSITRFGGWGWGAVSEAHSGQKKVRHHLFNLFWRKPKTYEYTLTYKKQMTYRSSVSLCVWACLSSSFCSTTCSHGSLSICKCVAVSLYCSVTLGRPAGVQQQPAEA